jgi:hypothetical protein
MWMWMDAARLSMAGRVLNSARYGEMASSLTPSALPYVSEELRLNLVGSLLLENLEVGLKQVEEDGPHYN